MIFIDGEPWPPHPHGTGTEDYFNTAFSKRMSGNLDYTIGVDNGMLGCGVFKFFFQTLVENAIIHGFKNTDRKN